jgi:hypothetical protein
MHVPAAEPRQREHGFRQDQAVGDDDDEIGRVRREPLARGLVAQGFRLLDRHASRERGLFDRTRRSCRPRPAGRSGCVYAATTCAPLSRQARSAGTESRACRRRRGAWAETEESEL